jgi:hypothetical protein
MRTVFDRAHGVFLEVIKDRLTGAFPLGKALQKKK